MLGNLEFLCCFSLYLAYVVQHFPLVKFLLWFYDVTLHVMGIWTI